MLKKFLIVMLTALIITGCGNEKVTGKQITLPITNSKNVTIEVKGVYTGEIDKNGKPTGKGTLQTINTTGSEWIYEGEFKNGLVDGEGTMILDSGLKLEGRFRNGYANGPIKETMNGKLVYKGEYSDNLRNGKGEVYNLKTDKIYYAGDFKDGVGEGYGKLYDVDGKIIYEGEVKNFRPNGKGRSYKENGDLDYGGNFVDGIKSLGEVGLNTETEAYVWSYSVTDVKTFKTIGDRQAEDVFVIVALSVKNNSVKNAFDKYGIQEVEAIGDSFFSLVDDQNREFGCVPITFSNSDLKFYGDYATFRRRLGYKSSNTRVLAGQSATNIAFLFEVPSDCKILRLVPKNNREESYCIRVKG